MLRARMASRLLSAQFDLYFEVLASGRNSDVRIHTIAEISSNEFTPQRNRAVRAPAPFDLRETLTRVATPRRLALVLSGVAVVFGAGILIGRLSARRTGSRA
jgi:hypothetical protein